jgi:hypothetical protein
MLRRIPSIQPEGLDAYFVTINTKITFYENMREAPALLELAIWKSVIIQFQQTNDDSLLANMRKRRRTDLIFKMQCLFDSIAMVAIIVPNA